MSWITERLGGDVLVIAEANARRSVAVARMRLARADQRGPGEADDRLQLGKRRDQRAPGKPDRPPRRRDDFERVADGRRIKGAQRLEGVAIGMVGHRGILQKGADGIPSALWAMRPPRKSFRQAC